MFISRFGRTAQLSDFYEWYSATSFVQSVAKYTHASRFYTLTQVALYTHKSRLIPP